MLGQCLWVIYQETLDCDLINPSLVIATYLYLLTIYRPCSLTVVGPPESPLQGPTLVQSEVLQVRNEEADYICNLQVIPGI